MDGGSGVELRSSTLLPLLAAVAVLGLGLTALLGPGRSLGALVVTALGALLVTAVLFDRPRRTVFSSEGIVRICPMRTGTLPWAAVVAIERTRAPMWRDRSSGGLIARTRRGRWLLSDHAEDPALHDAIARFVAEVAPGVRFLASRPT